MHSDQHSVNLIRCGVKCSFRKHKWSGTCYGVLQAADNQGKATIQEGQKHNVLITKITKIKFYFGNTFGGRSKQVWVLTGTFHATSSEQRMAAANKCEY